MLIDGQQHRHGNDSQDIPGDNRLLITLNYSNLHALLSSSVLHQAMLKITAVNSSYTDIIYICSPQFNVTIFTELIYNI